MTCNSKELFVFGATSIFINPPKLDCLTSLPLELSWKIFSYLDDMTLRNATRVCRTWSRIIKSKKSLRNRLNMFELVLTLGSKSLAKFYRRNLKKRKRQRYLPVHEEIVESSETFVLKSKRAGDGIVLHTKRYKL